MTESSTADRRSPDELMVCAENVYKAFGKLDVLKGIDFVVQPRRRSLVSARRVGQVDAAPLHQPPGEDRRRPDLVAGELMGYRHGASVCTR